MNLDELRSVQNKDRQKDSLQHLRDTFYADVGRFIAERKEERSRAAERADDPFASPEVQSLTDEIETAEEVAEAIYERRMGKLVKQASLAAADMPANEEGLTNEERELFDDMVGRIRANKTRVLDVLAGEEKADDGSDVTDEAPSDPERVTGENRTSVEPSSADTADEQAPPASSEPDDAPADAGVSASDLMGSGAGTEGDTASREEAGDRDDAGVPTEAIPDATEREPDVVDPADGPDGAGTEPNAADRPNEQTASGSAGHPSSATDVADETGATDATDATGGGRDSEPDRTVVRITQDVGEIYGVDDREYDLASEDVVTLPTANADPLVERDAAERLD